MATKSKANENKSFTCVTCGRTLETSRNFYKTTNPKYKNIGFLPHCKDCITEEFRQFYRKTQDVKTSIIATAMANSVPFNDSNIPAFDSYEIKTTDDAVSVFFGFMKTTNSIGKKILSSDMFDYIPWINDANSKKDEKDEPMYAENDLGLEIDDEVINFFGSGFTYREYQQLLSEYIDLIRGFDSDDYNVINAFKDIAYINLQITKAKKLQSDHSEIIKLFEARSKMFKLAGIDGKKDNATEKMFHGSWVKKLEQTRPATSKPEWDDNQFEEIGNIVAGHLSMMEGKNNTAREKYEQIVKPYTIDVFEEERDDDLDE